MKYILIILMCSLTFGQSGKSVLTQAQKDSIGAMMRDSSAYVNVKSYGAVGDGITDDTDALQSVLNYASTQSGIKVLIPTGTYSITRTLFYEGQPAYSLFLEGENGQARGGYGATILWNGQAKGTVLYFLGIGQSTIKDIQITSPSGDTTHTGSFNTGIWVDATNTVTETTVNNSSFTLVSDLVTVNTSSAHNLVKGDPIELSGLSNSAYDGKYLVDTVYSSTSYGFSYIGSNVSLTGGTTTRIKSAGSMGVTLQNITIGVPTGYSASGIKYGRVGYPATPQVSEMKAKNIQMTGAFVEGNNSAGIRVAGNGNIKNYSFEDNFIYGFDYGYNLAVDAGTVYINNGFGLNYKSEIYSNVPALQISNMEFESNAKLLMNGASNTSPATATIINCSYESSPPDSIAIDYAGQLTLIGNRFYNYGGDGGVKIVIKPDRGVTSIGNFYYQVEGYAPFYVSDGGSGIKIFGESGFYLNSSLPITSINDMGGEAGATITTALKPVYNIGYIQSANGYTPNIGMLRLSQEDSVIYRNHANDGNVVAMSIDTLDNVSLGGANGISTSKLTITNLPTDTTGLISGNLYGDINTGSVQFAIPKNLLTNADFTDWTGVSKAQLPDGWTFGAGFDSTHYYAEQNPTGQVHIISDGTLDAIFFQNIQHVVGTTYGYSFDVTQVADTPVVNVAGNYYSISSTGHYSGEAISTALGYAGNQYLFSPMILSQFGAGEITLDNVRVWEVGGDAEPPSINLSNIICGVDSFTTSATADTISNSTILNTDVFVVSVKDASPVADDLLSWDAEDTRLIVHRVAGTTSNLKYSYMRIK